jgi:hypothetical protein
MIKHVHFTSRYQAERIEGRLYDLRKGACKYLLLGGE